MINEELDSSRPITLRDLEHIERVLYKATGDIAVALGSNSERLEERIDALESRLNSRFADVEDKFGFGVERSTANSPKLPRPVWRGFFVPLCGENEGRSPSPFYSPCRSTSPRGKDFRVKAVI
jgi:hypothetical protein